MCGRARTDSMRSQLLFVSLMASAQARPTRPRTDIEPKDTAQLLSEDALWENFLQSWQAVEAKAPADGSAVPHPQAFFALSNAFFTRSPKEPASLLPAALP